MYRFMLARPFLFFSIILLMKSALAYMVIFETPAAWLWKPILKELPFIWTLFCLIEFFAKRRKILAYLILNLLITGLFFAVIMYYQYYGVIATYHALDQVNQVTAVTNSVFSLLHPQFLLIFTDVILWFFLLYRHRKRVFAEKPIRMRKGLTSAIFVLSAALCFFQIFPNRASMNEIKQAEQMGILNYEAYTLLADGAEEEPVVESEGITREEIMRLKGIEEPENPVFAGAARGKNLILIQMESFQNFLIDLKIGGQEVTPNMNALAAGHFYFPNFYQQVGQGNTSDAEFVVNTSFYIPPRGAASGEYAGKLLPSLPRLLKLHGYESATFHTNIVEFWNRGELYEAIGFDRYYDQAFFGKEDKVFFGSSDEVLYRKTGTVLEGMNRSGKPFYAHVISMSAHHPYTLPEEKLFLQLPEEFEGTMVGDYLRSQHYADYALGQFIRQLKDSGVWDDSLIMIYGDHVGLPKFSLDSREEELMAEIFGREYDYADMINVPLVIAGEGITYPRIFEQVGGQADIMPTTANLLGIPLDGKIYFGQDILNHTYNLLPQRYYLPSGSIISSRGLFIPGIGYEDGTHYLLHSHKWHSGGEAATEEEYERALKLLRYSDSYIRQLPDRAGAPE
jgi:phosphoglycerol transferase MdoB-like AlkP superfamily enzyme